jgi:hypothetical protein
MADDTMPVGADMEGSLLQQFMLLVGNLQGDVRGLATRVDDFLDQHSEKSQKDSDFRHFVYNKLGAFEADREKLGRLSDTMQRLATEIEHSQDCTERAEAAHTRLDEIEDRISPLETGSKVRRVLRSGTFQGLTLMSAWAAVIVAVFQWIENRGHP